MKFVCRCGHILSSHTHEEDWELTLLQSKAVEPLFNAISERIKFFTKVDDALISSVSELFFDYFTKHELDAYECPICKRVYIQKAKGVNEFSCYINEDGSTEKISFE